ncbi:MAG TPA: hypothetical protein VKE70_29940, partial [Candidatus Solibacter sp.]|nr:hypothetical protein [Candidatus Solibacter sp.]
MSTGLKTKAVCLCLLLGSMAARPAVSRPVDKPDLLLVNGHLLTINPKQPVGQAVAIGGGRIIWVGTSDE